MRVHECVFYIHGVTPHRLGGDHHEDYMQLHEGVMKHIPSTTWPSKFGGAEWGWQAPSEKKESHRALAEAQKIFGGKVIDIVNQSYDATIHPARIAVNKLRPTMMYGFGDMFYYVSTSGKWSIRNSIANQLIEHIEKSLPTNDDISLTLIGHSAGSVIAFDLLYYLFVADEKYDRHTWIHELGGTKADNNDLDIIKNNFDKLRTLVKNKKLRLRQLITLGSPISMLMYRGDALVEILASGETLIPAEYGLESELSQGNLNKGLPRWINFWDKDDPISWPIAPVMGDTNLVKDVYIDVSDWVHLAHNKYWTDKDVHKSIAEHWSQLT